jgi:hypothetical protein
VLSVKKQHRVARAFLVSHSGRAFASVGHFDVISFFY